jgi:membrane fusion protein, multidrug efflux system
MNTTSATVTGTSEPPAKERRLEAAVQSPKSKVQAPPHEFEDQHLASSIQYPVPSTQHPPSGTTHHVPKRLLQVLTSLVVTAITTCYGYRWYDHARVWTRTDNAYVAAHIHTVSARVAGTVKEVLVEENQTVATGSVLARLDSRDFEVRRQQARAQVAQAKAQSQQAEAQIAQARAQIAREQASAIKAKLDFERATSLSQGNAGAISSQEFDQAKAASDSAQAALQSAQSTLEAATALAAAAQAQEQAAQANLQDAELQLSYADIIAPAAGRIGRKNLETGNRVQPGQALLALVQPEVWVTANFKETQLARMKPGQPVRVEMDAFPGRTFCGRVESLSPASGAQFALLPPDNATGNFTRIVQRVPVKIVLDTETLGGCEDHLMPGMSAVVEVRVGK